MKGDRFNPMFIEQRRLGYENICVCIDSSYLIFFFYCNSLQWFMDRIARHPLLQASQYTRIFLESTDFVSKQEIK